MDTGPQDAERDRAPSSATPRAAPETERAEAGWRALHQELRRIARGHMRRQPAGHTLQTTALAHEAWIRLGAPEGGPPTDPRGFAGAASRAMRSILVDHARARRTLKRGGGRPRLSLEESDGASPDASEDVLLVHDALGRLEAHDPLLARLVELRFFGGLEVKEAALLLGVSLRTAHRMWEHARAWLYRDLHP